MLFSKQEIILRITFHYNKGHNKKQAIYKEFVMWKREVLRMYEP